jgi:hypothetical protein
MSNISNKGARAAINPAISTDGIVFDKTVNIEPTKVELVTEVKESAKAKLLGAILLFPKTAEREAKKYWVSLDHLFANSPIELFNKFYDNVTNTYIGLAHVGVKDGRVFLANA